MLKVVARRGDMGGEEEDSDDDIEPVDVVLCCRSLFLRLPFLSVCRRGVHSNQDLVA